MNNRLATLIISVVMASYLFPAVAAFSEEMLPGIHKIHGIDAQLPNDDLEPMAKLIGDASVVALGESYHTSGGFYRLKARLFRYLVEEKGFRALAIESPWEDADRVAAYVDTCEGLPEDALGGLYGAWRSESIRDLIGWICLWNQRHPDDRVHFFGFDAMQPARDAAALGEYFKHLAWASDDPRVQGIDRCSQDLHASGISRADFAECMKTLDKLWNDFDRREHQLDGRALAENLEWARIRLVGLKAWQGELFYRLRNSARMYEARDEAMAYLFLAIRNLRFPGIKTVIWAHNFHIAKRVQEYVGSATMGNFLADTIGEDYAALALVAPEIEIDWPARGCGRVEQVVPADSVEQILSKLGAPYLFVDLAFPGESAPLLESGRGYWMSWFPNTVVRGQWDGIFFLAHSPPMVPVTREPCR